MATEAVRLSAPRRLVAFYHEVMTEMKKVSWPDWTQIRQLSVGVVAWSLCIGGLLALMDVIRTKVLVRWRPALLGG